MFRARFWKEIGAISAFSLLDLHGLGLSRLAQDRGMIVDVKHIYLPLEILEIQPTEED